MALINRWWLWYGVVEPTSIHLICNSFCNRSSYNGAELRGQHQRNVRDYWQVDIPPHSTMKHKYNTVTLPWILTRRSNTTYHIRGLVPVLDRVAFFYIGKTRARTSWVYGLEHISTTNKWENIWRNPSNVQSGTEFSNEDLTAWKSFDFELNMKTENLEVKINSKEVFNKKWSEM